MQKTTLLPEDYQFNPSDFALFLLVMKNPKAYQNVLSIIMDEPDIKIKIAAIYSNYIYYTGRYL